MTIEQKLAVLERSSRIWRFVSIGLGMALLVAGGIALTALQVAQSASERVRSLSDSLTGAPGAMVLPHLQAGALSVIGADQKQFLTLDCGMNGGRFQLRNSEGESCVWMAAVDGNGYLAVNDGRLDGGGCSIQCTNSGGLVEVYNRDGRRVASVQSDNGNCGTVSIHDFDGHLQDAISGGAEAPATAQRSREAGHP